MRTGRQHQQVGILTRRVGPPAGFSLVELLVVIGIIGILGAVGQRAFRGYLERARDAVAIVTLREIHNRVQAEAMQGIPNGTLELVPGQPPVLTGNITSVDQGLAGFDPGTNRKFLQIRVINVQGVPWVSVAHCMGGHGYAIGGLLSGQNIAEYAYGMCDPPNFCAFQGGDLNDTHIIKTAPPCDP